MRKSILDARSWSFDLARFDDPAPEPTPSADPPEPAPEPSPEPEKGKDDGKDWQAEAEKWKALSRKNEDSAKANAAAAKKLADIEEAQKTETERLASAKEAAEKRAAAATERAVLAEVKALAADDFVDYSDAVSALNAGDYVDSNGDIDVDAIRGRLAELLEAKPHWKKATAPTAPPTPRPDPGQGARPPAAPTDFKTASAEEFAAELAKYGVKPRS